MAALQSKSPAWWRARISHFSGIFSQLFSLWQKNPNGLTSLWGMQIFLLQFFQNVFNLHRSAQKQQAVWFPQRCRHASWGDLKWLRSIRKSHYLVSDRKPSITSCCRTAVVRPRPKCRQEFLPHLAPVITPTSLFTDILPCNWQLPHPSTHSPFLSLSSVNNSCWGCSPVRWIMGGEQDTRAHHRATVVSQDSVSEGNIRFLHSARIRKLLFAGCIIFFSHPPHQLYINSSRPRMRHELWSFKRSYDLPPWSSQDHEESLKVSHASPLSSFRLAAAWSPEDVLSPSPLSVRSWGSGFTLAESMTGPSGSTATERALNTLCTWWPKERSSTQKMQPCRKSGRRITNPPTCVCTVRRQRSSCAASSCDKSGLL